MDYDISVLATDNVTPFYVYDLSVIEKSISKLRHYLPFFNLLYSIKANPNKTIVQFMQQQGLGFDVASKNELSLAYNICMDAEKIYYSAPGKTNDDLVSSLDRCNLVVDSIGELKRIDMIATSLHEHICVGVRVNIQNAVMLNSIHEVMGGIDTKFGISVDEFMHIDSLGLRNISIIGIHVYFGSQFLSPEIVAKNFRIISCLALDSLNTYPLRYVNFGGGFGVPYAIGEMPLDLNFLSLLVNNDDNFNILKKSGINLNLELGRFLVAECGVFVSKVIDIKQSFKTKYVFIDGGMNSFYRPIMTKDFHRIIQINATNNMSKREVVSVVGHLCTPIDTYYNDLELYPVNVGDFLAFENAGAYGYSMSLQNFLSFDAPKEVVVYTKGVGHYEIFN